MVNTWKNEPLTGGVRGILVVPPGPDAFLQENGMSGMRRR